MLVISFSGRDQELYQEWYGRLFQRKWRVSPVGFFLGSTMFICQFRTEPQQLKLESLSFLSLSCLYSNYLASLVLVRTNFLISLGEVVMISVNFFISATQNRFLVWNYSISPTMRFSKPVFYYFTQKSSFFSYQFIFQSYYSCLVVLVLFLGSYYFESFMRVDYLPRTVIWTYFYYSCNLKCSYTTFLRIIYEFSNILWMLGELPTSSNQLNVSSFMEAILICVFMKSIKDTFALFFIQCRVNLLFSRSVSSSSEGRLLSNKFFEQLREAYFQRKDLLVLLYQPFGVAWLLCIIILLLIIRVICHYYPAKNGQMVYALS